MFAFYFPVVFKNILIFPLLIRNTRIILTLAIPTGVPMTVVNEKREKLLLAPG